MARKTILLQEQQNDQFIPCEVAINQQYGFHDLIIRAAENGRFDSVAIQRSVITALIRKMHDCKGNRTAPEAKYLVQYRSAGFLLAKLNDPITLDHVVPVHHLVQLIIDSEDIVNDLPGILDLSVRCALTPAEHDDLRGHVFNPVNIWHHYHQAGIEAFNFLEVPRVRAY